MDIAATYTIMDMHMENAALNCLLSACCRGNTKYKKRTSFSAKRFPLRSVALFMIKILADNIMKNGIYYGSQHFSEVDVYLSDATVESENIHIKMRSPISVYSTAPETKETYFYSPDDEEFPQMVSDNFIRKYMACYGVLPQNGIWLKPVKVDSRNKYVTKYKNFYISGWMGEYYLNGERKYLDFLYQTGLGGKNSQGFGMFDII